MSEKKLEIIYFPAAVRKLCPVCGEVSYSLSGEHPQCAQRRCDPVLKTRKKLHDRKRTIATSK